MRKYPQLGGVAVGTLAVAVATLAVAVGTVAAAPAASSALRAAARPVTASSTVVTPGSPLLLTNGRSFSALRYGTSNRVQSTNWAGYVAIHAPSRFRYVQATFFVPYIDCARAQNSDSSHWVGLDGVSDSTVEQAGILAACAGTVADYSAWYEMYPKFPVYLTMSLHPGNTVVASVFYNGTSGRFVVSLADTTTGQHFSRALACPSGSVCQRSSAEVISEAPSDGPSILPLTDFRAQSYSGIRVTDQAGQRAGLRGPHWDTLSITMVNKAGTDVTDQPTAIYLGRMFGDYWQRPS